MQFPNALLWNSKQTPHTQLRLEFTVIAYTASACWSKIQNCVALQALDKSYANIDSTQVIKLSTSSGYFTHHQFNLQKFYVLPAQCIYVFCTDLKHSATISLQRTQESEKIPKTATKSTNCPLCSTRYEPAVKTARTKWVYCAVRIGSVHAVQAYLGLHTVRLYPCHCVHYQMYNISREHT